MAEIGRPSEMTEEKVKKLEEVFAIDGTVQEACFYADISKQTYYNWLEKRPELVDRFEALRERPVLKARQTVVKSLDDPEYAFKYLEKKRKNEFGNAVTLQIEKGEEDRKAIKEIIDELKRNNESPVPELLQGRPEQAV